MATRIGRMLGRSWRWEHDTRWHKRVEQREVAREVTADLMVTAEPPRCPQCGGRVAWDYTCHTYGMLGDDGKRRWYSCLPCDSAVSYSCVEWLDDDHSGDECHWGYTHGLNPGNPRATANEANRPRWIPAQRRFTADEDWRVPGVPMLGSNECEV